ncbi:MAG: hypothetical protein ICV62_17340 [Cyanobacteria bacterium Co-bin13]|nr:hypothetical protein [Cyanobacteria bacterium Co-bin13]
MRSNPRTAHNRPYPRIIEPGSGGLPQLAQTQRLFANWIVGEDGQLTCRWEVC